MRLATLLLFGLLTVPVARADAVLSAGDHKTQINGSTIAYHVHGKGPVVMVHPGGPGLEWSFVRMRRLEKFATVVYIEPIGTGASGRLTDPRDFTMDRWVSDVEGLRAHLGLETFVLLGHSHGGMVGQAYALAHPDRLRGLILYDTSPTTGPEWAKDIEANMKWFEKESWYAEAADALAHETSAKTDEEMTRIFRKEFPLYFAEWTRRAKEFQPYRDEVTLTFMPGSASTDTTASASVGVAPEFDVRDRIASIKVPTLVIVGKRDFVTSEHFAGMIHDSIQGSTLLVLEHSGHMGHIEEPGPFAEGIHAFLKSSLSR